MKKTLKTAMSIIMTLTMLLSLSINSLAMDLDFATPAVSEWTTRYWDFSSDTGKYSPTLVQYGGTVTYNNSADDKIASGKGLLVLQRFDAEDDGELYWQEYVNGTYGCEEGGFIELPITKSTANASVEIYTNSSGYCVALKWDSDGKLYGKYRESYGEATATEWKYICDIEGLSATFTLYIYTGRDCYNVAVNGKYVACGLYSMTAGNDKSQYVRISYAPGSAGYVYVDYKKCGAISSHVLTPAGVSVDTSNAANGTISVNTDFLGTTASSYPDWNLYTGLFNLSGELVKVNVTPVTKTNMTANNANDGYISQSFDITGLNYKDLCAKSFLWTSNLTPKTSKKMTYLNTIPNKTTVVNGVNPLNYDPVYYGVNEGYGTATVEGTSMTITRTTDVPEGENQYLGALGQANRGYPQPSGLMKFTLTKSSADMFAGFECMPSEFVKLEWLPDGTFMACYRESAEQQGPTAQWYKLGVKAETTAEIAIDYDVATSTYSMWINGIPVIADKYSRAVYMNTHNVPTQLSQVRIYSNTGKAGDTITLSNYGLYY